MDDERWKPLEEKYIIPEFIKKVEKIEGKYVMLTEARTEEAKRMRREIKKVE